MLKNIQTIINAVAAIRALLTLVEPIKALVREVERPGCGPEKKMAVLSLIRASMNSIESVFRIDLPAELILSFADNVIDAIVAIENAIGAFRKEPAAA